jgi:hypothetical protein
MKFKIRFNQDYKNTNNLFWRVIDDNDMYLVRNVYINVPTYTEFSYENERPHWNVIAHGQLMWNGLDAHIMPLS